MNAILAHHICDWLVPTRDLLLDRGMMGDGVIDLAGLRALINAAGFTGPEEVEIFSAENWWKRPPDEVVRTVIERFETVC
jgi:sugar phosphate isomerase/epimerase